MRAGRSVLYSRYALPFPSTNGLGSIAPSVPHSSGFEEPSRKGPLGAPLMATEMHWRPVAASRTV